MKRLRAMAVLSAILFGGCGDDDGDDVAEKKVAVPMDKVPPAVLKAAQDAHPNLTFFSAYKDTYKGQESIELKGKTKTGQIKEVEVSPDGKVLGIE